MNFNEGTYWQIQDYIKGKLDSKALMEFEDRMSQDVNLQQEIEIQRLADKLIFENRILSASQISLNSIESIKKAYLRKKIIAVGIVTLLSIGVLSYYISKKETTQTQKVTINDTEKKKTIIENSDKAILSALQEPLTSSEISNVKAKEKILNSIPGTLPLPVDSSENFSEAQSESLKTEKINQENSVAHQATKINAVDNHCSNIKIKGHVSVKNSCNHEANGHIYVNGFEGGISPYAYKVFSVKDDKYMSPNSLSGGIYNVIILDHSNCSIVYSNISVKEIACLEVEKSFNPFIGEIFELGEKDHEGSFIVYSKDGDIHYSKNFNKNENLQWSGMANNGVTETGYYIYTIKYKDGTSIHGEVTVTR